MLSFRRLTQTTKNVYFMYELKEPMYARENISARTLTHTYLHTYKNVHTVRFNDDHADTPIQQPGPAFLSFSAFTCVVQSEVYYTSILNYA